jgi:maltose O-acetyltransferase
MMLTNIGRLISVGRTRLDEARARRRWERLRGLGMHIGAGVNLPFSTWVDSSHCFLISIGDNCGFGPDCLLLAHDAQMDEFLDAARLGRIVIHESCHIGARCIVLPGVEIGPRTVVGAGSVVSKSLPPETVCAGNPARVICSLDDYLNKHRTRLAQLPTFDYMEYDIRFLTPDRKSRMVSMLRTSDGYMIGGHSAELRGEGGTLRTPGSGQVVHPVRNGAAGTPP